MFVWSIALAGRMLLASHFAGKKGSDGVLHPSGWAYSRACS